MQFYKNLELNSQDVVRNITSKESESPIFIHSLFRSGSTYLFNVFRRSPEKYWCYQEPIHEWPFSLKDSPKELLTSNITENQLLRHPILDRPYFYELYETYDFWRETLVKEIIYDDYFGNYAPEKTARYLLSLIEGAKGRPVIQECRTPSRVAEIRNRIGGVHIFLWRNPWDQWWSYKVTDYFDTVNQLIINVPSRPEVISRLQKEIGIEEFRSVNINEEFTYFNRRRLSAENSYFLFFTLWILGLLEGEANADILLNIDTLSDSEQYRMNIIKELSRHSINDIDFSDCKIPQSIYNKVEKSFFQKIEERVFSLLQLSGYSHSQIEKVNKLRHDYQPFICKKSSIQISISVLFEEISKIRELAKRFETREARSEQEYDSQLKHSREEHQHLIDSLTERDREIGVLQTQVESLVSNLTERDREIGVLQTQVESLVSNLTERDREIGVLQSRGKHLMNNLAERDYKIGVLQTQAERINTELNTAKAKIDELNGYSHHWWTVADGLNRELQAVYTSWSWRLTKPLRWTNRNSKKFAKGVKAILKCTAGLPRRFVRRFLEAAFNHIRRNPKYKGRIKGLLARWPRLQVRLYAFAAARQATASEGAVLPPTTSPDGSLDMHGFPVSVRITYQQLVAARSRADQNRDKEGQA